MTYGALLFAGPLERFLGYGLTIALIALAVGSLVGWASREKALIAGADSNSTSLLASALAGLGAAGLAPDDTLQVALAVVFATSLACALTFFLLSQRGRANIVRFVPFPVMAGFLASSGWLLAVGAMTIIIGTPLTLESAVTLVLGAWEHVSAIKNPVQASVACADVPASCSRGIAMICSSVNRDRFTVRSFQGPGL